MTTRYDSKNVRGTPRIAKAQVRLLRKRIQKFQHTLSATSDQNHMRDLYVMLNSPHLTVHTVRKVQSELAKYY